MKHTISSFFTAVKAENIKKKGTGFYWTGALLGVLSPILFFIVSITNNTSEIKEVISYNHLIKFTEECLNPFAYFFFPLTIIIVVSRITQIDHKNGGWQLMETQPVSKFSIYFSKFVVVLTANLIAILSFVTVSLLCAYLLKFVITIPKNVDFSFPATEILHLIIRVFLASLLISAIQYVISVLIPSFIWSIIIGFFGLLLMVFLTPFDLVPVWYPYRILLQTASNPAGSDLGHWFTFIEYFGIACSALLLYVGYKWYEAKSFKAAFFGKTSRIVQLSGVIAVTGGLMFWLLQPNQMPDYKSTVLAGSFQTDNPVKAAYLTDQLLGDTLAVIPIKNNAFHYKFDKNLIPDNYILFFDKRYSVNFFFGQHDSTFMEVKIFKGNVDIKFKGTRLAENQLKTSQDDSWSMVQYYMTNDNFMDNPRMIQKELYSEWNSQRNLPGKFATADNYIPKADYKARNEKLISVKYLNMWEIYLKKMAALHPDEKITETADVKKMRGTFSLTDESLLSNRDYFDYVNSQLTKNIKEDIDDNTKSLLAISKLKPGSFKDKMLFWQLRKTVQETAPTEQRATLLATYNTRFSDPHYAQNIVSVNKVVESFGKGKPAPALAATSVDGARLSLSGLKGKFVMIDTWATWCGPCRQQSPYFEKMALKYRKNNIQFVALSVDENMRAWFVEAKSKSKSVLQLHADQLDLFNKDYAVESIPRFIFIDKEGKFINARMPYPEDQSFEMILRKSLGLPEEE